MNALSERSKLLLLLAAQGLLSALFVGWRLIDADEGFYLSAAREVAHGHLPYVDFFYPQMPLLPFLGAPLASWGISSLLVLRALTAVAGLLLTWQTYRFVRRISDDQRTAMWAAVLIGLSGLLLAWHTTFKTYGWTDLFMLVSFSFLLNAGEASAHRLRDSFVSFLFLGLAVGMRSVLVVLAPLFGYWLWRDIRAGAGQSRKPLLAALAGFSLPLLPALVLFVEAPGSFWFSNLGFHLHRGTPLTVAESLLNKLTSLGEFIALPQTLIILGLLLGAVLLRRLVPQEMWRVAKRGLVAALVIAVVYLFPKAIHMQYFQQTLPFLVIATVPALWLIARMPALRWLRNLGGILYLFGIAPFVVIFLFAPRAMDQKYTWDNIDQVVSIIQSHSEPGDTVLSEWAGYPVLAERSPILGGEHCGFQLVPNLDPASYSEFHLLSNSRVDSTLRLNMPHLVVVDGTPYESWLPALSENYAVTAGTKTTSVYEYANAN